MKAPSIARRIAIAGLLLAGAGMWLNWRQKEGKAAPSLLPAVVVESPSGSEQSGLRALPGVDTKSAVPESLEAKIAETARRLGPEHARTLALRTRYAVWLNAQGRYAGAEAEHRAVLEIRLRNLGPGHPDTLQSRKLLGAPLFSQGKFTAARVEYEAVFAIRAPNGLPDYTNWPAEWWTIMRVWFPQRHIEESAEAYTASLDAMTWVLILDFPPPADMLTVRAVLMDHLGKLDESEKEFRRAAKGGLGPEHPNSLRARHYINIPLNSGGNYAGVEANEREILSLQLKTSEPNEEDILSTRIFLAASLRDQEKYAAAKAEATQAYEGLNRLFGPADAATLAARRLLDDLNAPR